MRKLYGESLPTKKEIEAYKYANAKDRNDEDTPSTPERLAVDVHPLVMHFNGDKAIGTYIGNDQKIGIHICLDDKAEIGAPSLHKNGKVPNESTLAIMTFERVESINMMIAKLENAKRMLA